MSTSNTSSRVNHLSGPASRQKVRTVSRAAIDVATLLMVVTNRQHQSKVQSSRGRLALTEEYPVEAPGAAAGEGKIEEDEAVEDRGIAAIEDREEIDRRVRHEIGDRHVARQDEGNRPREQAERQQRAANELDHALISIEREQRRAGVGRRREAE